MAACARSVDSEDVAAADGEPEGPAARVDSVGDPAGAGPEDPFRVQFSVRGGFAGFELDLLVMPDGRSVLAERGRRVAASRLSAAELGELGRLLEATRPATERVSYGRPGQVADGMQRSLQVAMGLRTWSVEEHTDPSEPLPPGLRSLFDRLMEIAMRLEAQAAGRGSGP